MKYYLLIPLFFTLLPPHFQDIPEDSNVIIITTTDTPEEAFTKMGKLLIKEGYTLEQVDKTFLMLVTKIKAANYGFLNVQHLDIKITVEIFSEPTRVKMVCEYDDPAISRAMNVTPSFDRHKSRARYTGGGSITAAFEMMNEVAQKYPSAEITYSIEEVEE